MDLFIVRHAESHHNRDAMLVDRGLKERCDPALTTLGLAQAEAVAQHLATYHDHEGEDSRPFTQLVCSPMYRALQTAAPISQALGLKAEVWLELHEFGGPFLATDAETLVSHGRTRAELAGMFPFCTLPAGCGKGGWWSGHPESWPECHERAARLARRLTDMARDQIRILLVTHARFTDVLLKAFFGIALGGAGFFITYNTGLTRLHINVEDAVTTLLYLNRLDHLKPSDVTGRWRRVII